MDEARITPIRLNANAVEFNPAPPPVSLNVSLGDGGGGAGEIAGYPKKRKREKRAGGPTPEQVLMREIGLACKANQPTQGIAVYQAAKIAGTKITPSVYNALIALCSGLSNYIKKGDKDASVGASETEGAPAEASAKGEQALDEVKTSGAFFDAAFELYRDAMALGGKTLQEPAYTSLIRICGARGDTTEGLRLLEELRATGTVLRLRTFLPLLAAATSAGDAAGAFAVYDDMRSADIIVGEREYVLLLNAATKAQDASRAEQVLLAMAEDVLRPSQRHTWPALEAWFTSPAALAHSQHPDLGPWVCRRKPSSQSSDGDDQEEEGASSQSAAWRPGEEWHPPPATATAATAAGLEDGIAAVDQEAAAGGSGTAVKAPASGSAVNPLNGRCNSTGVCLRSVELSSAAQARMMAAVEEAVLEQSRADDAALKWKAFTDWMARKGKRGYDVLIDGANVGYYKQNYAGAPKHVAFEQIDAILRHCQALGRKPLIVLHQRHTFVQNCPKQYEPMVQQWRDEKVLYSTPNGSNDDWYWLYAALWFNQRDDDELAADPIADPVAEPVADSAMAAASPMEVTESGNGSGVMPRGPIFVVSNDEMRDHHFRMPSAKVSVADVQSFVRWKERHQCTFNIWGWDRTRHQKHVALFPPTPFSVRMQATKASAALANGAHGVATAAEAEAAASSSLAPTTVGATAKQEVVCWHVPSWAAEERGFDGHAYSHETDFAQTSKPLDPDACDWLIIAREKLLLPGEQR